jgi:hypothetical protein
MGSLKNVISGVLGKDVDVFVLFCFVGGGLNSRNDPIPLSPTLAKHFGVYARPHACH